jgi:type I restriction enzyme R subunit
MASGTKEIHFEEHIEQWLTSEGSYTKLSAALYDKDLCLIPEEVIAFIQATQPEAYEKLLAQYGPTADQIICQNLEKHLRKYGTLEVFRMLYKDRGQTIRWYYPKPNNNSNPEHAAKFPLNRFSIVRQLKYSNKNENSIDLVLFLNGIPIITAELKNALTGQYITEAIKQYKYDRDPKEPLLEYKRCLVHFAVSTEQVKMTTRLSGEKTFFLPLNQDIENPVNPEGFSTEYLWKDVWNKNSILDLIQNYIHLQTDTEKYYDEVTGGIKEKKSEKIIFPRWHQRRAVSRILDVLPTDGVGTDYLIQHSAGSGKSNTIAWLAHRLSGFYKHADDTRRMFDCIIVVTDRKVLDRQLQDNIKQFEQVSGVVEAIDDKKTSADLAKAIEGGKSIIITTLQKFPVISETVGRYPNRSYAVIVDEAHSSQSGESARHLRRALSLEQAEEEDKPEKSLDEIVEDEIERTGKKKNISYFAFTATPKNKTLELFGTQNDGKKDAFDKYTMQQAISEGFIMDVLQNYTTFRRYYKLAKRPAIDDKEYETRRTVRLLNSYVDLQEHAIEIKSRIMLEHFATKTYKEVQGKARAMVVTRSRLHAVRYKRKFEEIMREMNLPYKALVAFSGSVYDAEVDQDFTETNMNNLGGKISIVDAFKMPQYRILIVANKFQTGFDEPNLHTMFVDKKLGGVNSVQTLSRLNRMASGKRSTMILDFVNNPEHIQQDFQAYYKAAYMLEEDETDPNTLYDILTSLNRLHVYSDEELERYCNIFFRKENNMELLQPILNNCVKTFEALEGDDQFDFRSAAIDYVRLYRFLSQIITFKDVDLEKHYVFLVNLIKKLPKNKTMLPKEVLEEVDLVEYKVQKEFENIEFSLLNEDAAQYGMQRSGASQPTPDEYALLTNIIKTLNEMYGLNLSENDRKDFELIKSQIETSDELNTYFNPANSKENIRDKFYEELDNALLGFVNTKLELYNKLTEDKANQTLKRLWFNEVYDNRMRGLGR